MLGRQYPVEKIEFDNTKLSGELECCVQDCSCSASSAIWCHDGMKIPLYNRSDLKL